jgi:hypothetical protein
MRELCIEEGLSGGANQLQHITIRMPINHHHHHRTAKHSSCIACATYLPPPHPTHLLVDQYKLLPSDSTIVR